MVSAMIGSQDPTLDFMVLMAAPGRLGLDLLAEQNRAFSLATGAPEAVLEFNDALNMGIYKYLITKNPTKEGYLRVVNQVILKNFSLKEKLPANVQANFDKIPGAMANQWKTMSTPWMKTFLAFDPDVYFSKVKCPVLALNGTRDLQVFT